MSDFLKIPVEMGVPNPIFDYVGTGSPVTALANAAPGSMYRQKDGGAGSILWQKNSSAWEALSSNAFTQTVADARYGQLAISNTWAGTTNAFQAVTTTALSITGVLTSTDSSQSPIRLTTAASPTDSKKWWVQNLTDGTFRIRAINDAETTGNNAIQFVRSGITVSAVYFGGYLAGGGYSGPGVVAGDIVARRSSNTGVYYFGDANTKYLYYDSTNFNLSGGELWLTGNLRTTASYGSGIIGQLTGLYHTREAYMGYSTSYKVVILGQAGAASSVMSLGVDPTGNTSGSFTGDGSEILMPNITRIITPNAANNGYYSRITFGSAGDSALAGVWAVTGAFTGNEFYNTSGAWYRSLGNSGWFNATYSVGIYSIATGRVRTYNGASFTSEGDLQATTFVFAGSYVQATTYMIAGGTVTASDFVLSSDRTLKKDLALIKSALDKVNRINGYTYRMKADPGRRRVGIVAQEIQEILPEAVYTQKDGTLAVAYDTLIPLLIEAIKELSNGR